MKKQKLLEQIAKRAKEDAANRRDPRYLGVMGFLVAKGFLRLNREIALTPNARIRIEDALWAGENVEPRILEVLPAAVLRLPRHFDLDPVRHAELAGTVRTIRACEDTGQDFMGIPFGKLKVWAELPLPDKRIKAMGEKKITKTFRLAPEVVERIRELARESECTETEALERQVLR